MRGFIAALVLLIPSLARAQLTPCPTVSDQAQLITVIIVNAPYPVYGSYYDLKTSYLFIGFTNKQSRMFTSVPRNVVQTSGPVQWASVYRYPSALMQEDSVCPLLADSGKPLIQQGNFQN